MKSRGTFDAGGSRYSAVADTARARLIKTFNGSMTDEGQNFPPTWSNQLENQTVIEDSPISDSISATDPDGIDLLKYIYCLYIDMASQQISIKQEVYQKLKSAKKEGESFSDTIERLIDQDSNTQNILNLYGIAKLEDEEEEFVLDAYASAQKEVRDLIKKRFTDTVQG